MSAPIVDHHGVSAGAIGAGANGDPIIFMGREYVAQEFAEDGRGALLALHQRCEKATESLSSLNAHGVALERLVGKVEGVRLAMSYIEECLRADYFVLTRPGVTTEPALRYTDAEARAMRDALRRLDRSEGR